MTAIKLYELTQQHRALEKLLDGDDVPTEVVRDTLEALEGDIEAKSTSVAHLILNLESFSDEIKRVADATAERAARVQRRAESIRAYLLLNLQTCGITKVEAPEFTISVRKNPAAVAISDLAVVPSEYMVTPPPPPPRPDKAKLKEALKGGVTIPGVWLEQGEHLSIKV
jgi:hypothetical protein